MSLKGKRDQKGRKKTRQSVLQNPRKEGICSCGLVGTWALVGTTVSDAVEVPLRCGFKLTIGEKIKILVKLVERGPGKKMRYVR